MRMVLLIGFIFLLAGCANAPQQNSDYARYFEGETKILGPDRISVGGQDIRLFGVQVGSDTVEKEYALTLLNRLVAHNRVTCVERWPVQDGSVVGTCMIDWSLPPDNELHRADEIGGEGGGLVEVLLRAGAGQVRLSDFRGQGGDALIWQYRYAEFNAQRRCVGIWKLAMQKAFSRIVANELMVPGGC